MICRKCNKLIPEGGRYCKYCGFDEGGALNAARNTDNPIVETRSLETKTEVEKKRPEKRHLYYVIGGVAAFVLVIGLIVFGFSKSKEEPNVDFSDTTEDTSEKFPDNSGEENLKKTLKEEDDLSTSQETGSVSADEVFLDYLRGKVLDSKGSTFSTDDEALMEYTLLDMNGDGVNELIVRSYGTWIPGVYVYKDGNISFVYMENAGSAGVTYINTKNQYVGGDTTHEGRYQYIISELDENDSGKTFLYFAKMWGDWSTSDSDEFYKLENPPEENYTTEMCEKITESEYESLIKEYAQENTSIEWKKVKSLSDESNEPDSTSEQTVNPVIEKTLQAYDKYIKENYDTTYGPVKVSLIYITSDDIPEVVVEMDGDITWDILGYENGIVKSINAITNGTLYYVPKGDHIYSYWGDGEMTGKAFYSYRGYESHWWAIDFIETTQGMEYYYSDEKNNNPTIIPESEANKLLEEGEKDCIFYEADFFHNVKEAYTHLKTKEVGNSMEQSNDNYYYPEKLSVKSVTATSELNAKSVDGMTYNAQNLCDGNLSTPWVEGVPGVGNGEQIVIKLDSPHKIDYLELFNGILKSKRRCMINGQVSQIEVEWGNGNKQIVTPRIMEFDETEESIRISDLMPTFIEPDQPCTTDTIIITILDAIRGSKYDDTGISEIEIYGK